MAHFVKCKICEQRFDRDKEAAVEVGGRRYAHAKCAEGYETPQEQIDLDNHHQYLKTLFKNEYKYLTLQKQIEGFITKYGFTYSGILKSLIYWYDIKENTLDRASGRIGIVPYIYDDAREYYFALYLANQRNENKDLSKFKNPEIIEVKIKKPKRNVPTMKLFNSDD